jgi:hypothetical protein
VRSYACHCTYPRDDSGYNLWRCKIKGLSWLQIIDRRGFDGDIPDRIIAIAVRQVEVMRIHESVFIQGYAQTDADRIENQVFVLDPNPQPYRRIKIILENIAVVADQAEIGETESPF